MIAERRLRKFLEGELSEAAEAEVKAWIEKNPDVQILHDKLVAEYENGPSLFHRKRAKPHPRRGSRIRASTLLPGLGALILVLVLAQHWYSRPGSNSTFTFAGGNGQDVDLLYLSKSGWRYLDADFRYSDSLAFKNSGPRPIFFSVWGIWAKEDQPHALKLYKPDSPLEPGTDSERTTAIQNQLPANTTLRYLSIFYDSLPLPDLEGDQVIRQLSADESSPLPLPYRYQAFAVPQAGASQTP
jgi:hypothetical protein